MGVETHVRGSQDDRVLRPRDSLTILTLVSGQKLCVNGYFGSVGPVGALKGSSKSGLRSLVRGYGAVRVQAMQGIVRKCLGRLGSPEKVQRILVIV